MLIVLSSLLMWVFCALSAIFSIYTSCSDSWCSWPEYHILIEVYHEVLFLLLLFLVLSLYWYVILVFLITSVHEALTFCTVWLQWDPFPILGAFMFVWTGMMLMHRGVSWFCQLWMEPFGLDCTVSSAHSPSSRFDLLFKLLLEASNPFHQVRDAVGNLGAPNTRVAASVYPYHSHVLCFVSHLEPLW